MPKKGDYTAALSAKSDACIARQTKIKKIRGVYNDSGIIIQADNYYVTAKQIADHELAHERLRQNPGLAQNIEREIRQDYTEEEFDRVIDAYISKMRGIVNFEEGMSDREYDEALQRVKEETICDAYAGINAFGAHAEQYQEQTQRVMQRRGVIGRKENENAAALARRGVGDDGEKYSLARTADNKPFVEVEQDILAGVPAADWVKTVKENLKQKFPDGITVGNNEINIDYQSRQEMTYSRYMRWFYNKDPQLYADKLRATSNSDEILLATTNWVNEGLNHPRKDKITDFARGNVLLRVGGNDYTADVVVGTRKDGSMVMYDVLHLQPTSFKAKETNAATTTNPSPGAGRNTTSVSGNSIRQGTEKSQERMRTKHTIAAYLDIKRPYDAGTVEGLANDIAEYTDAEPGEDWDYEGYTPKRIAKRFIDHLEWNGYDGVVVSKDEEFGGTSFVVLFRQSWDFKLTPTRLTDTMKLYSQQSKRATARIVI